MPVTLNERDDGEHRTAHVGDQVEVRLPENATTGYRWTVDRADAAVLAPVDGVANYPGAVVGSGGEAVFRFRVTGAGESPLALKLWRHWEGERSVIQRYAVTINAA